MVSKKIQDVERVEAPADDVKLFSRPADSEIKTDTAEPAQEADREQLIYIGPTIRKNGVGIRTNQVFIGGSPAYFKALYTEYPQFKTLFVPVDKLQESLKQINTTGTALNAALLSLKGV